MFKYCTKLIKKFKTELDGLYYDLACVHSLNNSINPSINALKKAIQIDNKWIEHAKKDNDLKNIRNSNKFKELIHKK